MRCEDKDRGGSRGYTPNDNPPTPHTNPHQSQPVTRPPPTHPLPSPSFLYPTIDPASTPPHHLNPSKPFNSTSQRPNPPTQQRSSSLRHALVSSVSPTRAKGGGFLCETVRYYRRNGGIGKRGRAEGDGRGGMRAK